MKKIILALTAVCTLSLAARMADKPLLKVFDAAYRQEPYKNVLLSPWGIQECFGMIYGGAGKVSAAELTRTLGIDAALGSELRQARELLKQSFPKFNSFNAILFDRKYTLQKNFTNFSYRCSCSAIQLFDV